MNKCYTWVFFNLLLALPWIAGCLYSLLSLYQNKSTTAVNTATLCFGVLIASCFWVYRVLLSWKRCIQEDNNRDDRIVKSL